ncbi:MAG: alkane 1-monooxygenase [Parvularculaceae bacterium]|nr:alkane 1-monooxygenase [Parvularculaceae bacterium]
MSSTTEMPRAVITTKPQRRWMFTAIIPNAALSLVSVLLYFALDGAVWAAIIPFVWFYVAIPLLDAVIGEDHSNPPDADIPDLEKDEFYNWVMYATVPFLVLSFYAVMAVLVLGDLPIWAAALVIYAGGIGSGQAINLGHELGHRTDTRSRTWAKLALGIVGYGHFCVEHNRGHHVNVATPEDCSSARMNETIYAFTLRDIIGAFRGGWEQEAKRLRNKKLPLFSHHNEILQSYAVTAALAVGAIAWLGWAVVPWLILHHFFGYFSLTLANYVEHYGLKRERRENGRYEPCQPKHSWNTNHLVSNMLSINLQRHSDHHAHPQRPYQCLRNFEQLPRLPSGYPGCFGLALFPPLWFSVMNPKVRAWAGGDDSKLNWG